MYGWVLEGPQVSPTALQKASPKKTRLIYQKIPDPSPGETQVVVKVFTCGMCRTDLHIIDNELPAPSFPLVLGHQVVGVVQQVGAKVSPHWLGKRVGVPWMASWCHTCFYCEEGKENLCNQAHYTGYTVNGGLADFCVAEEEALFPLPHAYDDVHVAPLLCAGLIGYRSWRFAAPKQSVGFYGFGASAHLLIQIATYFEVKSYVFTRSGDETAKVLAKELGAYWVGDSLTRPPEALDAAIIFAPVGALVPQALQAVKKGGRVVCAGIHMSDIPRFPYKDLWSERSLMSVANLTHRDGVEFLRLAEEIPLQIKATPFTDPNEAIAAMRSSTFTGAAVVLMDRAGLEPATLHLEGGCSIR